LSFDAKIAARYQAKRAPGALKSLKRVARGYGHAVRFERLKQKAGKRAARVED
jgi:hypothetical protein